MDGDREISSKHQALVSRHSVFLPYTSYLKKGIRLSIECNCTYPCLLQSGKIRMQTFHALVSTCELIVRSSKSLDREAKGIIEVMFLFFIFSEQRIKKD